MMVRLIFIFSLFCMLSSCLKTRADLGEEEQSQVYGRKNADNQMAASGKQQPQSQLSAKAQAASTDDRDEAIRSFNGRIESLENQINNLQKEKDKASATTAAEAQKNQALQETLTKMEVQLQKLIDRSAVVYAGPHRAQSGQLVSEKLVAELPSKGTQRAEYPR